MGIFASIEQPHELQPLAKGLFLKLPWCVWQHLARFTDIRDCLTIAQLTRYSWHKHCDPAAQSRSALCPFELDLSTFPHCDVVKLLSALRKTRLRAVAVIDITRFAQKIEPAAMPKLLAAIDAERLQDLRWLPALERQNPIQREDWDSAVAGSTRSKSGRIVIAAEAAPARGDTLTIKRAQYGLWYCVSWVIPKTSKIRDEVCVRSPEFRFHGHRWCINLWPKGNDKYVLNNAHMSIYIENTSMPIVNLNVRCKFRISLEVDVVDQPRRVDSKTSGDSFTFGKWMLPCCDRGWHKFGTPADLDHDIVIKIGLSPRPG
jgi:hypothetical protein